jgi:hypothetical protein
LSGEYQQHNERLAGLAQSLRDRHVPRPRLTSENGDIASRLKPERFSFGTDVASPTTSSGGSKPLAGVRRVLTHGRPHRCQQRSFDAATLPASQQSKAIRTQWFPELNTLKLWCLDSVISLTCGGSSPQRRQRLMKAVFIWRALPRAHRFQIAPLPLHGDAGGIADLDPDRTSNRIDRCR